MYLNSLFIYKKFGVVAIDYFFFFQAEDGIRDLTVTGVQTCALPISIAFNAANEQRHVESTLTATKPRPCRSEEHTSELQSQSNIVCRLLLEKKNERRRRRDGDERQEHVRIFILTFESKLTDRDANIQ